MTAIRRSSAALALLAVSALAAGACGSDRDTATSSKGGTTTTAMNMDHSAGDMVQHLEPAAFKAALAADPKIVLIDVRTPDEFAAGHLAGARNIDVNSSSFGADIGKLSTTQTYAVYCHSGNRSRTATQVMMGLGYAHLLELTGGIQAWTAARLPVTTS